MPKREDSIGGFSLAAPHSLNRSEANVELIELSAIFAKDLFIHPSFGYRRLPLVASFAAHRTKGIYRKFDGREI
jgi:hypothetical protein